MYHILFNKELSFLTVIFKGDVTIANIITFYNDIIENKDYPKRIKLLTDYRKAMTHGYDKPSLEKLILHANQHLVPRFNHVKWANLSLSPIHTTGAALFAAGLKASHFDYAYFTTEEKAMAFLMR